MAKTKVDYNNPGTLLDLLNVAKGEHESVVENASRIFIGDTGGIAYTLFTPAGVAAHVPSVDSHKVPVGNVSTLNVLNHIYDRVCDLIGQAAVHGGNHYMKDVRVTFGSENSVEIQRLSGASDIQHYGIGLVEVTSKDDFDRFVQMVDNIPTRMKDTEFKVLELYERLKGN